MKPEMESQCVEWKETWRDEWLKWISAFANAEGGVLHIGRNDSGAVIGLANAAKLLVDIPNKVRDVLGIVVEVALRSGDAQGEAGGQATRAGLEYLEIKVDPYPYPVSYKG